MLQSLFYLTIALHVSGIIITHLQEQKTIVTTASGNRYTVIDRVFTVHNLLFYVTEFILSDDCSTCFGYHYHPSSGAQSSYSCFVLLKMGDNDTRNM